MKKAPKQKKIKEKIPVKDQSKSYTFFEDVWSVARQIPKGRVTSYGAIANYLGTKLSARMVGWAMMAAHDLHPPEDVNSSTQTAESSPAEVRSSPVISPIA